MNIYLGDNCLNMQDINYVSPNVVINGSELQSRCPLGICVNDLRSKGCLLCDNEKLQCNSCFDGYVLFNGMCFSCVDGENCPFNNTFETECIDQSQDFSHCKDVNVSEVVECLNHVCIDQKCKNSHYTHETECELEGKGCRGCRCLPGWYPNYTLDCFTMCGDGNVTDDEECDDINSDGCGSDCKCENGWETQHKSQCKPICGDSMVVGPEECDGGAGCTDDCHCGEGWYVNGTVDCYTICGDDIIAGDEECEMRDETCENCRCRYGEYPLGNGSCGAICGDQIVAGDEKCEFGGDGCDSECKCLPGWEPAPDPDRDCLPVCGDLEVLGDEECEITGDGCSDKCHCYTGWYSSGTISCFSVCGDNIVVGNEECEVSGSGCRSNCTCDIGWRKSQYMSESCKEICGDGRVVGNEECDSTPGCSKEVCRCGDKNPFNNDTGFCMWCGNAIVEGGEECDQGPNCDNSSCRCSKGYVLDEIRKECVVEKEDNKEFNIPMFFAGLGILIFLIVVILVIVLLIKRAGSSNYNYHEVDMDIFEVRQGKAKVGKLTISKTIFDSTASIVMLGDLNGDREVAVKAMKRWGTQLDSMQQHDIDMLKHLDSPYILKFYGTCIIQGRIGIVMEYAPLGDLEKAMELKPFSSELKIRYAKDICLGMAYLHSNNIIHRNLKLSNIFISSDDPNSSSPVCKISDFGTARDLDTKETLSMTQSMTMTENLGTPLFMAPELLNGSGKYSVKADVYSYGIILCGLWNQTLPYDGQNFTEVTLMLSKICEGLRPQVKNDCPQSYVNLMHACWDTDPHKRPTFQEISSLVFGVD